MKKIAIISSGYFPVPPVKGGAVESLVNMLVEENEKRKEIELEVYSIYDKDAKAESQVLINSKINYIKTPYVIKFFDYVIFLIVKLLFKKKKVMSYRYIFQRLYYINKIGNKLNMSNYDALIFENHPTLLLSLKKKNNFKKYAGKYYYHAHNEITNCFGARKYLMNVRQFICVSNFIRKSISSFLGLDDSRFCVLRNKVSEEKFRNIEYEEIQKFKEKYGLNKDEIVITFTGRLNKEKGVKELLIAFKNANLDNAKLVIAGSYYYGSGMKSEYEKELKKIASDIQNKIVFTGNIKYDEMPVLYAASDILVIPSIWNDPAPLTVIESITSGKPLITTNMGGIPEYANKNNSIIVNTGNNFIAELTIAIRKLCSDSKLRYTLIENTKKDSYNWTQSSFYNDFVKIVGLK